jgi:small subunit ribosomal protein S4
VDLYGNGGENLQRRLNQPPGEHGPGQKYRRRRQSDYDRQMREKQKVKRMYGVRERQFRRFYHMAERAPGQTGEALLSLLERRLDNVVYRMGWARTRPQARQFVNHGHVNVDGQRISIPSFLVEADQEVALRGKVREIPDVKLQLEADPPTPAWLDRRGTSGRIMHLPERQEIQTDADEQLIVEFYSR